jgi:hypothetical protein
MPNLIRPNETTFVTKEGECLIQVAFDPIVLELNINLNSDGLSINPGAVKAQPQEEDDEKPAWVAPEFSSKKKKIKFGKTVEEE